MMSEMKSRTVRIKKKKKKNLKKKFLLTSKKCWLIEEKLIPLYEHLVDSYSVLLREEWNVKLEETDVEVVQQVKEEPQDDYLVDSQQLQLSSRINQLKVVKSYYEYPSPPTQYIVNIALKPLSSLQRFLKYIF